jgi:uncharacterized protein (DUF433 family)
MSDSGPSVQRSFRLSARTSALLDELAAVSVESRNSLVERLLGEALRLEAHPLIRFRSGTAGRREPFVFGTRLLVRQLVSQCRAEAGDVVAVAEALEIPDAWVRAALSYYADFPAEIDADLDWARAVEASERARWEREQAAFA